VLTGVYGLRRQPERVVQKHGVRPSEVMPRRCPCHERTLCVTNLSPVFFATAEATYSGVEYQNELPPPNLNSCTTSYLPLVIGIA
jgi:hypothetical protein